MRSVLGGISRALRPLGAIADLRCCSAPGAKVVDFFLGEIFDTDKGIPGRAGANELVKLGLQRCTVAILRVLDQEYHQEGNDGRSGVDYQLPGFRIAKRWPREAPYDNYGTANKERHWMAGRPCGGIGDYGETPGKPHNSLLPPEVPRPTMGLGEHSSSSRLGVDPLGRELRQELVGLDFLLQRLVEQRHRLLEAKLARPGLERAIARDLVMLYGLRRRQ